MAEHADADRSRVVSLADRRQPGAPAPVSAPVPAPVPARGQPVAFGVELPARGDIVFSVAALTQLITIADQAGLDASSDLGRAIASLARQIVAHGIGLPPELEAVVEALGPAATAELHALPGGRE